MAQKSIDEKKWTVMFYFASDNSLAPGIISHLKALKNAGYHKQANVLAYFDPQTPGTPSHIFDVNRLEKLDSKNDRGVFQPNDPYVRDLMFDKLWGTEESRTGQPIRSLIQSLAVPRGFTLNSPEPPEMGDTDVKVAGKREIAPKEVKDKKPVDPCARMDKPSGPEKSLSTFLDFCAKYYPAEHYMLFIIGHGLVVGDDVFLYDEHAARHSVTLRQLGDVLRRFKNAKNVKNRNFELVSFHSCSMISVEITSELQGTANFMLASQGNTFVGSWPYLSILTRLFNDLSGSGQPLKEMLKRFFDYIYYNSTDFILAGYSFDLCLCELSEARVGQVEKAIAGLSKELQAGLAPGASPLIRDAVLLAHWKSQSFWQENYSDLYDFCFCLDRYCDELGNTIGNMGEIQKAAGKVMDALLPEQGERPEQLIVRSTFVGPAYQYAHGLSIYFPWTEPPPEKPIIDDYRCYRFQKNSGWMDFLKTYFLSTMRDTRRSEPDPRIPRATQSASDKLKEDMACIMYNSSGWNSALDSTLDDPIKTGPRDPMGEIGPRDPMGGGECACASIKNFPHDTRPRKLRLKRALSDEEKGPSFFDI
jgi:hypothetical protein